MSPLALILLAFAGAILVTAVFLAGRAMRGHWWDASDDEDEELLASGWPPPKPPPEDPKL